MSRYFLTLSRHRNVLTATEVFEEGNSHAVYSAFKEEVDYEATKRGWVQYHLNDSSTIEVDKNEFIEYSNKIRTFENTFDNNVKYEGKM